MQEMRDTFGVAAMPARRPRRRARFEFRFWHSTLPVVAPETTTKFAGLDAGDGEEGEVGGLRVDEAGGGW